MTTSDGNGYQKGSKTEPEFIDFAISLGKSDFWKLLVLLME